MKMFSVRFIVLLLLGAVCFSFAEDEDKYWLFFTDKGPALNKASLAALESKLDERVKWRRAKVMDGALVDETDMPVYQHYMDELAARGVNVIVTSKWLNAVSVNISASQVQELRALPFIKDVQKVLRGKRKPIVSDEPETLFKSSQETFAADLDYGYSLTQNQQIRVPDVHAAGITGKNVLIAVLDTGFNLESDAFDEINVVDTYDFIFDDENVDNEDVDTASQNRHGTNVLSLVGGYSPGELIGPAFDAGFLLAKTEDMRGETEVEEDYWIAAAEWAEGLGADIITTSLGYIDWYTYDDLNGQTARITVAADLAVQKGVVVITSAGNEGNNSWLYVTAPADGFDVIAVGAVSSNGQIASFSSRGPTRDGRIKPEVVAMGVSCYMAYPYSGYGYGNGTSFAAPLVAGTAALMLSAHPQLTPKQVRQALIQTADRVAGPDNNYGFGLIDAYEAVNYWGAIGDPAEKHDVVNVYPNPFSYMVSSDITFLLDLQEYAPVRIELFNALGQSYGTIVDTALPAGKSLPVQWDGRTLSGRTIPSGIYFYRVYIGDYKKVGRVTILQ